MENLDKYINNPQDLNNESLTELKKLIEEFPFFQSSWMLYLKNLKNLNHDDLDKVFSLNSIRIADREKLFYFLNPENKKLSSTPIQSTKNPDILHANEYFSDRKPEDEEYSHEDDLISHFISSQPNLRLKTDENAETTQNDFSEESVSENEDFITETFAEILVQQKKYDKAIDAFQKLSLKFPEKSIYFAGRIEEINNLKNN